MKHLVYIVHNTIKRTHHHHHMHLVETLIDLMHLMHTFVHIHLH